MIVVMKAAQSAAETAAVVERLRSFGGEPHIGVASQKTYISLVGPETYVSAAELSELKAMPGVEEVSLPESPYKLVARTHQPQDTIIHIGPTTIGGGRFAVIAGPCSVESREQLFAVARLIQEAGADLLRGGAFKPRSSPYSFQGLGEEGLWLLAEARQKTGLPIVTEVLSPEYVSLVAEYADVLQIGSRNMHNFALLRAVGEARKPVLLKRGMSATLEEFLLAAEYLVSEGCRDVVLCERGIRTFEHSTRNTLDLGIVPLVKQISHLPIVVDPCHATGRRELVLPMSRAALAAGADGVMVEVHPQPEKALSDGPQSLRFDDFRRLMAELRRLAEAVQRPGAVSGTTAVDE